MNNLKNEVICDECEDNILDVGIIDFGHLDLKYSGDNQFKKGKLDFSFIPAQCGECCTEIGDEIADELSEFYPLESELSFEDITKSSIWFSKFAYTPQFCPHCGIDIKEEGLNYFVILYLDYDNSKGRLFIREVDKYMSDSLKCANCNEELSIYETIEYAKERTNNGVLYEIPLPQNIFY